MIRDVQLYFAQRQFDMVIREIAPLLALLPQEAALHNVAGAAHAEMRRFADAITAYDASLRLQPDYDEALSNRAAALIELKRFDEALASIDHALRIRPDFALGHANRGVVLKGLGRWQEALESYERACAYAPADAGNHYNRANLLRDMRRFDDAVSAYDDAIRCNPGFAEAYSNRGNTIQQIGRLNEALASYDQAIALNPNFADAYVNSGNILHLLRRMQDAADSYAQALRADSGHGEALTRLIFLKAHMCDWTPLEGLGAGVFDAESEAIEAVQPFNMLALDDSGERHLERSIKWTNAKHRKQRQVIAPRTGEIDRIRIGYFSADFHCHATMELIAGLLEHHDKSRFEIHAFSFGPDLRDAMRHRAVIAVEHFHDVRNLSDSEIAEMSRELGIDIAVDLKGYTQDARAEIFAIGAAPIQIAYLGYPGTSGAEFIDYLIADSVVVPEAKRHYYSEKLISLPHSYQVKDNRRALPGNVSDRAAHGLPADAFVFCCFNNSFKISEPVLNIWMRLLAQVEGSVLWLLADNKEAAANLRKAAEDRGIAGDRLVFAERVPVAQHLARHRCADLFLDTFAYNAHTTASDALWMGLPVVTKLGDGFAARVGGSLLTAMHLPELVTDSEDAYEQLALALANDTRRLAAIKDHLEQTRLTAPLFDTATFARNIERAYALAFDRFVQGLEPDDIILTPLHSELPMPKTATAAFLQQ